MTSFHPNYYDLPHFFSERCSTSLNSLEADGYPRESASTVDGNVVGGLQVGTVAQVVGHLEKTLKSDLGRPQNSNDFVRSTQRSSYTGPGFFHKSVSSPSVQWYVIYHGFLPLLSKPLLVSGCNKHA